jgi:hypothetical protein
VTASIYHHDFDFSEGSFYWAQGNHYFIRLWPHPIILHETPPNHWNEVRGISDDFNLTVLRKFEADAIRRYSAKYQ